jgi:hypothetical protein
MSASVELIVPGLLGPVPPLEPAPQTPTLDLLLDCATQTPAGPDLPTVLLQAFGVGAAAPYALAADDGDWDRQGWWLCADPVHLRPDRDLLRLFDARYLGISRTEADALVAAFNAHFADDGLSLHAPVSDRWYLHSERPRALETTPLPRVLGHHIDGHLPTGADASRWAALMSEAQMLLYQHDVNRAREAAGRPAVNGLWCWGGGRWQAPPRAPDVAAGSAPLLRGLTAAAGMPMVADAEVAALLAGPHRAVLAVREELDAALKDRDTAAWAAAAEQLDDWLGPLPAALGNGEVDEVRLYPCDGRCLSVRGGDLGGTRGLRGLFGRLRGRRRKPLASRATAPPAPG